MLQKVSNFFIVLAFVLGLCCLFSCSDDIDEQQPKITDFYYVKYVWQVEPYYTYGYLPFAVSCKNNTGEFFTKSYDPNYRRDELICGPFIYGYKIEIYLTNANGEMLEIYISKNNSPFALKAMSTNTNELEYTIDF